MNLVRACWLESNIGVFGLMHGDYYDDHSKTLG